MEVATRVQTDEENDWLVAGAEVRAQFWIDTVDSYYTVYIDYDKLIMVGTFWQAEEMLARGEWQLHNSSFKWTERNTDEKEEHDETVVDLWSDVKVEDNSDSTDEFIREYRIYVNDTYMIQDMVEVIDPWNFEQDVTFEDANGSVYLNIHMYYDGLVWRQTLDWDALYSTVFEQSSRPENDTIKLDMESTIRYNYPGENGFVFTQTLNTMDRFLDATGVRGQFMENTIVDQNTGREWHQILDLQSGTWTQSHRNNGVLIWQDTWDMSGTNYDPFKSHHTDATTLLAASHAFAEAEGSSSEQKGYWTATGLIAASIIGVGLYTCVQHQKRKVE